MVDSMFLTCAPNHVCDAPPPSQEQGTCVQLLPAGSPCDDPSDSATVGRGYCQNDLACAPDGICKEMIPEGTPCPEPGTLAFCEVRTSCIGGVCTADDTFALFESICAEP
jgi:hypothetical protein